MKDKVKFLRQVAAARSLHHVIHIVTMYDDPPKGTKAYRRLNTKCKHYRRTLHAIARNLEVEGFAVYAHFNKSSDAGTIAIWQDEADQVYDLKGNFIGVEEN